MTPPTATVVWDRFKTVGLVPDFGPEVSLLLIAVYRRLAAEGRPMSPAEVIEMGAEAGVTSAEVLELLETAAERDEDGAVRGIVGLSLNDHPHKFLVHGRQLHTWCALDPLFIAPMMTDEVEIESLDPRTGDTVRVTVSPDGVGGHSPSGAVVSIVVPESVVTNSVEAVWTMFCHKVHFFTSRESGEAFFAASDDEVHFLAIEEAFDLGRLAFGPMHEQLEG